MLNMNWKLEQRKKKGRSSTDRYPRSRPDGPRHGPTDGPDEGNPPAIVSDIVVDNAVHAFKYAGVKDLRIS